MISAYKNIKICCDFGEGDNKFNIRIRVMDDDRQIALLEFVEITEEFNQLCAINGKLKMYSNLDELKLDIAEAYLQRFLGRPEVNNKLDLLTKMLMREYHYNKVCGSNCVYCDTNKTDSFPEFIMDINDINIKGQA